MFKYLYQTHYFVMLVYIVCMFVQDSDIEKKNQQPIVVILVYLLALLRPFQEIFKRFCAWQNARVNTVRRAMMYDVYYNL